MTMSIKRQESRARRKRAIRKRVNGTVERPRLSVFRSARHIYAQVIDDTTGKTLVAASTLDKELTGALAELKHKDQAKLVGKLVAERCKAASIERVVFDRNGYIYHGRVSALADGAREAGLDF